MLSKGWDKFVPNYVLPISTFWTSAFLQGQVVTYPPEDNGNGTYLPKLAAAEFPFEEGGGTFIPTYGAMALTKCTEDNFLFRRSMSGGKDALYYQGER